uniref:Eco57I restriction-modification methylase domain-containing protein n=1 Tax=Segatella hominis TaxID=2518605 RepID=UPI004026F24F
MAKHKPTYDYTLIYAFSIDDGRHDNMLKVGKATINYFKKWQDLTPDCELLIKAAKARITQETGTAAIEYKLEYTELAIYEADGEEFGFDDHDVHDVLENSGYHAVEFANLEYNPKEWYPVTTELVIKAINAVKHNQSLLERKDWKTTSAREKKTEIVLREEQELAVTKTLTQFLHGSKMLWDAKMRFGKTLCALEVVKRKPFNRVLILTHRPAVRDGWFKDFNLLQLPGFHYVTRVKNKLLVDGQKIAGGLEVLKQYTEHDQDYKYIYFASIQDIRGSKTVNKKSKFDKNNELFKEKWDLLIIDEAHEGIRTEQGKAVVAEFQKNKQMKSLYLSGTPYNILKLFKEKEIYRWDYNMEQDAKERWTKEHPDEKNPYEGLARLNICTYNLGEVMTNYSHDENDYFNFTEFFRVDADTDKFVHEDDVRAFLKLMTKDGENKELNYPFATSEYRDYFQHTLWSIPGVDAARCLSAILREDKEDNYFRDYEIVNIAGKGDSDIERENEDNATREKKETEALAKVQNAIRTHEKTITLTCGRCTTGVSVPEWTAVLMLSGSYETKAARYLQTIFRCQTPFKGKTKRECYAFDFAPDRTLTVIDNYLTEISRGSGSKNFGQKKAQETERFLKFCSFISIDGSKTVNFDTRSFMKQVNRAYSEEIMRGRTRKLFDNLDNISDDEFKLLKEIDARMSVSSSGKKGRGKVKVTDEGVTGERAVNASSYSGTPKETKARTKNKTKGDQAYEILEKIIIRFPMLIYGAVDKLSDSFTIDKFIKNIDNASWEEFMPREWTKTDFLKVAHVIKNERFIAWAESIFEKVNTLEGKPVDERVNGIADIISEFRYPDKETVLTPWRVVNMHLSDTVGGYDFFGEKHRDEDLLSEPRFVGEDREVTKRVFFTPEPKILELNSKTGLYPLYMAYTLYRLQCKNQQGFGPELTNEEKADVWKKVIEKNIFVVCKTKMAERITNRTLVGFSKIKVNAKCYTDVRNNNADIIETLKNNPQHFVEDVKNGKEFWKANNNRNMKFNAVVSNPPYQVGVNKEPLYHHFISIGMEIGDLGTLIHPGRFLFNAGKTPKAWNQKMLNDEHFKVVKYWKKSDEVFDAVDIKGGVAVTMWDKQNVIGPIGTFVLHDELRTIQEKVESLGEESFSKIVYSRDLYQLTESFYKENPELEGRQSKGHRFDLGTTAFSLFPEVFSDEKPAGDGYALVVGRENDTRIGKWIKKEYLKLPDNFESYKVVVPKSNGSGHFGESLSSPFVAAPFHAQNTTFLSIGKFDSIFEAEACLKYIKTKFVRCMLGILKVTQDNPKSVWSKVPLQNFTQQSDINWDLSIPELDAALYQKYNLTQDEIDFIESNVSAMQ